MSERRSEGGTKRGKRPGYLRSSLEEQRRIATMKPVAPLALHLRLWKWFWGSVLRESAPQLALAGLLSWFALPHLGLGRLGRRLAVAARALTLIGFAWEARYAWQAHRSVARIDDALEGIERSDGGPRVPRSHLVVPPLAFVTKRVTRKRGIPFAEVNGTKLRLDIYRSADDDPHDDDIRPAVIQIHGGGWIAGSRFEQGIPLLNHLAALGWVGFNIDYRLSPEETFPAQIVDVKRAIAWVRENAADQGVDPDRICITGGSAGGHLTALAALTPNDPAFQPGFEEADTTVAAAVPFYGVYDFTNANGFYYSGMRDWVLEQMVFKRPYDEDPDAYRAASPSFRVNADAPPFLVIHGDRDTLVPVDDARDFVERLRAVSNQPALYVELAGAEHAFDIWPSERTAHIAEAIGRFLTAVVPEAPLEDPARTG